MYAERKCEIITDHKLHSKLHNYKSALNSEHIQVLKVYYNSYKSKLPIR